MEIKEIGKKELKTMERTAFENMVKEKRKKDDKLCKGMFEFIDAQGGFLEFCYRFYPGEPLQVIKLIHGEICEMPMGLVRHLNNTKKKVRRYDLQMAEDGKKMPRSYTTISRVRFTPMDAL